VRGEANVVRVGHDEPGHRGGPKAPHPVREHHRRDAAEDLEALGEQAKRRSPTLIGSEAHEADPAPSEHGAEHLQAVLGPPVDHQVLAGGGDPRAEHAAPPAPLGLGAGHRTAEVAARAAVAGGSSLRQQALGRDPAVGLTHPLLDQAEHHIGVARTPRCGRPLEPSSPRALDHAANGLVVHAADRGRGPVAPGPAVGVDHVHRLLR
jgi:hypothetical protein